MSELRSDELEFKGKKIKAMPTCEFKIIDGHIEADCESKEASHELADLLEREVIIRVKPVKITEAES